MKFHYPSVSEVGVAVPRRLRADRFQAGFDHGLRGGKLDHVEYLRLSFREGFRAAKLYLKALRKERGIVSFPLQGRIKMRAF